MKHCDGKDFNFLIGKSIVKVEKTICKDDYDNKVNGYKLTCDDGTIIEIATNEGCGGCSNGWSSFEELIKLQENNNVITNVLCKYDDIYDDEFQLFIYYENDMMTIKGDDGYGNGYYGGGFYVTIKNLKGDNL